MSENIIIALIAASGSIIGGIIGAYAQIESAKIKEPLPSESPTKKQNRTWLGILIGAIVGAASLLLVSWGFGILSISFARSNIVSCDKYGIKIISPMNGEAFPINGTIKGIYSEKPENAEIWIFTLYRNGKNVDYRPRAIAILRDDGTWVSEPNHAGEIGNKAELVPFIVGKDGKILINYHLMTSKETGKWFAITELPSDVIPCSSSVIANIVPSP